jgi:hypothetical protein
MTLFAEVEILETIGEHWRTALILFNTTAIAVVGGVVIYYMRKAFKAQERSAKLHEQQLRKTEDLLEVSKGYHHLASVKNEETQAVTKRAEHVADLAEAKTKAVAAQAIEVAKRAEQVVRGVEDKIHDEK